MSLGGPCSFRGQVGKVTPQIEWASGQGDTVTRGEAFKISAKGYMGNKLRE
jgi:hypothetical protein